MTQLYRVIVPVTDLEIAQVFYASILEMPGSRVSPERHYFDCEGTILVCYDPKMYKEKATFTPNPENIYIAVDHLQSSFDRCSSAGATITAKIQSYPWGETSFYFDDPFGNKICFVDRNTKFTGQE